MNKRDIEKYNEIKNKTFTTSEVIKDSFVDIIKGLKKEDFVVVENQRQKISMVIQDMDKFISHKKVESKAFSGKVKTTKDNVFLARHFIKENIYFLMRFESNNITFPDIESLLANANETKMGFEKEITINLMDAYKYILYSPKAFDADEIIKLNGIVAQNQALEWGKLRDKQVYIKGTSYKPPIPKKKNLTFLIDEFRSSKDKYKSAAILLIKLIKSQPFFDGNKRVAFLTMNRLLIENSLGVFSLRMEQFDEFNRLLNSYYNGKEEEKFVSFIQRNIFNTIDRKMI